LFYFSQKRRAHSDLIPEGLLHCQLLGSGLSTLCWDAGPVWGVMMAGVSFHACNDAGPSVLRLTPGRTVWLKLKDQHCLSDNVNN